MCLSHCQHSRTHTHTHTHTSFTFRTVEPIHAPLSLKGSLTPRRTLSSVQSVEPCRSSLGLGNCQRRSLAFCSRYTCSSYCVSVWNSPACPGWFVSWPNKPTLRQEAQADESNMLCFLQVRCHFRLAVRMNVQSCSNKSDGWVEKTVDESRFPELWRNAWGACGQMVKFWPKRGWATCRLLSN